MKVCNWHPQWMDSTAHGDLYKKCKKKGKFIKKHSHNSWNSYIPSWLKTIPMNSKKKTFFCSKRIWGIFCATFKQTYSQSVSVFLANWNTMLSKETCLKIFVSQILVWKSQSKRKLQGEGLLAPLKILLWLNGCYSTKADPNNPSFCAHMRLDGNANFAPGNLKVASFCNWIIPTWELCCWI